MEKKITMSYVSLSDYTNGQIALARIETLKTFTIKSDFSVSREEIACILGFELPEKGPRSDEEIS